MSTVRLSATSYVVLGVIALRGPSTPYDLKRAIGHSVGYFWPFPHAQMYSEPHRLAEEGLLTVDHEAGSRRRKTYSLTPSGMDALRAWLKEPTGEAFQLRNLAELKLFFGEFAEPGDLHALAREQIGLHEERLATLKDIEDRFGGREDTAARMVPLALGRRLEQVTLEFWRDFLGDSGEHEAQA